MQHRWLHLFFWLTVLSVLTAIGVGGWVLLCGDGSSTSSLKWLQFIQTLVTFILPSVICAWLWDADKRPFAWLKMEHAPSWQDALLAVAVMICAIPAINLLADLNSRIDLPESLGALEQWMTQRETEAADLTQRFLQADNIGMLLVNIGLMALFPAIAEEISFRGTLQQLFTNHQSSSLEGRSGGVPHLAIWATAVVFSAIHFQFYGFIPRMLMGAAFGYVFAWSGNLWLPILMHFTNNAVAVIAFYALTNYADTIGAGTTWWIGVLSLMITCLGLLIFYRRTHTR